jgi:iron(III) transport system substrate-binding protein
VRSRNNEKRAARINRRHRGENVMLNRFASWCAVWLVLLTGAAWSQDPPAVQAADSGRKDALRAMIQAAKAEGAVAYWDAVITPETNDELTAEFRKLYGLPASFAVKYTLSATLNLVTRVEQEVGSGNVTIDVASLASPPWIAGLVAGDHIMRYDSPEHAHYARAIGAGMGRAGFYVPNGAYCFVPSWNTETLDFKGTSWRDVLGAVPPGRISTNDAPNSATGLLSYMGLRQNLGIDFFRELAKMKPRFIVRSEQTAEALVTGQDLMAFGGSPGRLLQSNEKGATLKFLLPKEGVVLLGAGTFILAKAPHPNAAKLWIDFTLSEAGQTILSRREALISVRSGFKSPLPEYAPAIDELNVMPVDWSKISADEIRKGKAEWQSIFSP